MWLTRMWRKHHEAAKFLMVGGVCFMATTCINYALKLTVLREKKEQEIPVTLTERPADLPAFPTTRPG